MSLLSSGLNHEPYLLQCLFFLGYVPSAREKQNEFLRSYSYSLPQGISLYVELPLVNLLCGFYLLTGPRLSRWAWKGEKACQ